MYPPKPPRSHTNKPYIITPSHPHSSHPEHTILSSCHGLVSARGTASLGAHRGREAVGGEGEEPSGVVAGHVRGQGGHDSVIEVHTEADQDAVAVSREVPRDHHVARTHGLHGYSVKPIWR